jgi:hypothetical protein
VTDSGREIVHDIKSKPGVSNLIEIMAVASGYSINEIEARYDGQGSHRVSPGRTATRAKASTVRLDRAGLGPGHGFS